MNSRYFYKLTFFAFLIGGCSFHKDKQTERPIKEYHTNLFAKTYEDCTELSADLTARRHRNIEYNKKMREWWESQPQRSVATVDEAAGDSATEESANQGERDTNITNNQEDGIDEADFVKRSTQQIFVLHGQMLEVISRDSLEVIGKIDLTETFPLRLDWNQPITQLKMHLIDNRLVIHGQSIESYIVLNYSLGASALEMPVLSWEKEFEGWYIDARLKGDALTLITSHLHNELRNYVSGRNSHELSIDDSTLGVPCQTVVKSAFNDENMNLTSVRMISLSHDEAKINEIHVLGGNNSWVYMGPSQIILSNLKPHDYWSQPDFDYETVITRIKYDANTGDLAADGRGKVAGYLTQGQWSVKELADNVSAIVATSHKPILGNNQWVDHEVGRNHLWLLQNQEEILKPIGTVINFGKPHEDVRAVRFVGERAYIVTFEKTDPLYAFNIENPVTPVVEDALEIPGFSTYLEPFGDHMVGIGYDAVDMGDYSLYQGIQLSLYHSGTPGELEQLDRHIYGDRGSYSDATGNHHAFFSDKSTGTFGFPLVTVDSTDQISGRTISDDMSFSGAIVMGIVENEEGSHTLQELGRLSHFDMIPQDCRARLEQGRWWQNTSDSLDINRMFLEGDKLVSVSRFGLKFHDPLDQYAVVHSVAFSDAACEPNYYQPPISD
ncbi:MAG: beta-propeller domain-containing protein [Pseudobacteriovorax sp.]|nr:beta-propeller domain-containing protein [Pseudobacteriovorax sp.]